jgi:hypothetical protein
MLLMAEVEDSRTDDQECLIVKGSPDQEQALVSPEADPDTEMQRVTQQQRVKQHITSQSSLETKKTKTTNDTPYLIFSRECVGANV